MRSKWKIGIVVLILVLALGGLILNRIMAQPVTKGVNEGVQTVKTAVAESTPRQNTLQITGTVDAVDRALISARVAGIIESLSADNGDWIQAGQVLVQIDSLPYQSLVEVNEAALIQTQAQLNSTQSALDRMKPLYEAGAVSQQDYENNLAALTAAEADVAKATTAVNNAHRDLGYTQVTSPISGLIANRNIVRGQMVGQGTPLMEVQDLSQVCIYVAIGQSELGNIKPGLDAEVKVDAFANRVFPGTVTSVNPVADPQGRVFMTKITVANPEDLLRAGMFASVKIMTGEETAVLSIPQAALTSKQKQFYVFVPEGDVVKMVPVEIGEVYDGRVQIMSGLTEGQAVITTNINKLKEDDRIQIVTGQGV